MASNSDDEARGRKLRKVAAALEAVNRARSATQEAGEFLNWLTQQTDMAAVARLIGKRPGTVQAIMSKEKGFRSVKLDTLYQYLKAMRENLPGGDLPTDLSTLCQVRGRTRNDESGT